MKRPAQGRVPSREPALRSLRGILTLTLRMTSQLPARGTERGEQSLRSHSEAGGGVAPPGPEVLSGHEDACSLLCGASWPRDARKPALALLSLSQAPQPPGAWPDNIERNLWEPPWEGEGHETPIWRPRSLRTSLSTSCCWQAHNADTRAHHTQAHHSLCS